MSQGNARPPLVAVVRFEKSGRAGKAVTLVERLPLHPEGKETLLKVLKKKLGAGGALKNGVLELQGDHRDRLPELLAALGHPSRRGN